MNAVKGIGKVHEPSEVQPDWLEKGAPKKAKAEWNEYLRYYRKNGVKHPKIKYPVMFGKGDNQYPGCMATEAIPKGEVMIRVPSKHIINTKKAFYAEGLRSIYYEHPEVFGKSNYDGEENILYTFILHEMQKKENSPFYHMIKMWPKEADILMHWEESDLDQLQDPTLACEAQKQYDDVMQAWNKLYMVLSQYPNVFEPSSITFFRFKWVYTLGTNRCFASNWPCVCQMVPFAD